MSNDRKIMKTNTTPQLKDQNRQFGLIRFFGTILLVMSIMAGIVMINKPVPKASDTDITGATTTAIETEAQVYVDSRMIQYGALENRIESDEMIATQVASTDKTGWDALSSEEQDLYRHNYTDEQIKMLFAPSRKVILPDVVGMTEDDAVAALKALGIVARVAYRDSHDTKIAEGICTDQDLESGQSYSTNTPLIIYIQKADLKPGELALTTTTQTETSASRPTTKPPAPRDIADNIPGVTSQGEALILFKGISSATELLDMRCVRENSQFYGRFDQYGFYGLSPDHGRTYYIYMECFDTGLFELRLCNANDRMDYVLLSSKPLPRGYDLADCYDRWMRITNPKECITQETLNSIMATGYMAPFICGTSPKISPGGRTGSDDGNILCWQLYIPASRTIVAIYEDYNKRQMYYSAYPITAIINLLEPPFVKTVPLNEKADKTAYRP